LSYSPSQKHTLRFEKLIPSKSLTCLQVFSIKTEPTWS
jgi:hypothetical protein